MTIDKGEQSSRAIWYLTTISSALHSILYALWFGGIIAIGAFVAPTIAGILHAPPAHLDYDTLKMTLTAGVIGQTLRHFSVLCYVAGVLMIACDLVDAFTIDGARRKALTFVRGGADVLLLASALYLGAVLTPRMDMLLSQGNMVLFNQLHQQYETIVIYNQTPLLLLSPIITAIRDVRPRGA